MMGLAERLSVFSLRDGLVVASEIAAFSALGASIAWLMWAAVEPVGPMPAPSLPAQHANTAELLAKRLARIPNGNMRGDATAFDVATSAEGFVLHGARAGADGAGSAIIAVNGAPQAAFSVGEEIKPGVRLVNVASDHVEISANGRSVRLAFASTPQTGILPARAQPEPSPNAMTASFVNALSLQPVTRPEGRPGLQVTAQADLGALGPTGLRPGDIILKINGADISAASLGEQAALLQAGRSVEIVYERGGQTSTTRIGRADQ
jgi:general secretion pathway protein C